MKNKYFSTISKNIILVSLILIVVLLAAGYGINISKYLDKTNDFILKSDTLEKEQKVELVKCIDGDTAKVSLDNKIITIRFLAIDTPEIGGLNKKTEYLGQEASEYTCNILKNSKKITITYEKGISKQDKYKRHLVWLFVDNELIQDKLIKQGYAKIRYIYAKYTYTNKLFKLQTEAQNNRVGIWKNYIKNDYKDTTYVVIFKVDNKTINSVEVKSGSVVELINNPSKNGYIFKGWVKDKKLFDFSLPITDYIIVDAKFDK